MIFPALRSVLACLILLGGVAHAAPPPNLPAGVQFVRTVEGITEYRLANGLKVLLFPDASKPTVTVNVTYMVGSRHENYGETGMAHLLEHLMFKGTPTQSDIPTSSSAGAAAATTAPPGSTAPTTTRRSRRATTTCDWALGWRPTAW